MQHKLNHPLPENLVNSLKTSISKTQFMPGTVCFFMFNHADNDIFCHFDKEFTHLHNVTFKRKLSFLSFLKNLHPSDQAAFIAQQKKIKFNFETWFNKGHHDLKIAQDVRFMIKIGHFVRLLIDQKVVSYRLNQPEWSLGSCTDISHIKDEKELSLAVFSQGNRMAFEKTPARGNKELFTHREIDVLKLLSKGYKSKDVEKILQISLHTVRTHRRNMLKKTGLKSTTQLVNFSLKEGILKSDI